MTTETDETAEVAKAVEAAQQVVDMFWRVPPPGWDGLRESGLALLTTATGDRARAGAVWDAVVGTSDRGRGNREKVATVLARCRDQWALTDARTAAELELPLASEAVVTVSEDERGVVDVGVGYPNDREAWGTVSLTGAEGLKVARALMAQPAVQAALAAEGTAGS